MTPDSRSPQRGALSLTLLTCVIALLGATLMFTGCASLPAARMALPEALSTAEAQTFEGLGGHRAGTFRLGNLHGRFERGASQLQLFDRLTHDRASVRYTLEPDQLQADCKLIGNTATLRLLHLPLKRAALACHFSQAGQPLAQRLELRAVDGAAGTRDERRGRFVAGDVTLELQSVHRVQGSALPLAAPVGYLLSHRGQAVAALDLSDSSRPRLWQRAGDAPRSPMNQAVVQVALALALLWDPAAL